MSESKLKKHLEQLREEMQELDDVPGEDQKDLENIVEGLQRKLDGRNGDQSSEQRDIQNTLSASIARFEASHPRLTGVLNDIMVTLSNMGI